MPNHEVRKFNFSVEQFTWKVPNEIPIQGGTRKKSMLTLVTEACETAFAC